MRQPTFSAATRPRKFGFQGAGRFGFQTKTTPFASRAFSPDCEPQRAFRGQPPQAALRPRSRSARRPCGLLYGRGVKGSIRLAPDQTDRRSRLPRVFSGLRPEARHTPRRPCGLPHGLGATGRMLFWVPDQNNALRFSGFQPEARLRATLGQDAPHGRGVSDPSPCAPPRQAGRPGPIGHRVVGFCGTAWGERTGPVWTKNRLRRALTCVSLPPSQRRAPFRGFHKGDTPLCVLFTLLFAQAKNKPSARTGPGIPVPLAAHLSKKVRCCTAAQKEPQRGGGLPASQCRLRHTSYQ